MTLGSIVLDTKRLDTNLKNPSSASENVQAPAEGNNLRLQAQADLRTSRDGSVIQDPEVAPAKSGSALLMAVSGLSTSLKALMTVLNDWEKKLSAPQPQPDPEPPAAPKVDPQVELIKKLGELINALMIMVQKFSVGNTASGAQQAPQDSQGVAGDSGAANGSQASQPGGDKGASSGPAEKPTDKDKPSPKPSTNPVIGWIGLVSGLLTQAVQIGLIPGGNSGGSDKSSGKLVGS